MITRHADSIYMVVNAGCADKDLLHLNAQLKSDRWRGKDVRIQNLSDTHSLVALQGPQAVAQLLKGLDSFSVRGDLLAFLLVSAAQVSTWHRQLVRLLECSGRIWTGCRFWALSLACSLGAPFL